MTEQEGDSPTETNQPSVREQLQKAVGDLWSSVGELGEDYVVFVDRRRLNARVQRSDSGLFAVSWEQDDGSRVDYDQQFENPREAAFHAYQGPH
jgi:hypothetical protein